MLNCILISPILLNFPDSEDPWKITLTQNNFKFCIRYSEEISNIISSIKIVIFQIELLHYINFCLPAKFSVK